MGKHVKKKTEAPRFKRQREEASDHYVADTWLDAAEREGELDDLQLDDGLFTDDDIFASRAEPLPDDRVEVELVEPEEEMPVEPEEPPVEEELPVEEEPRAENVGEPESDRAEELLSSQTDEVREEPFPEAVAPAQTDTADFFSAVNYEIPAAEEILSEAPAPVFPEPGKASIEAQGIGSREEPPAPAAPRKKKPRPDGKRGAASAKKKRRRRAKKFKKGLKIYVGIMLFLILAACVALWVLLARYQGNVDSRLASELAAKEQAAAERAEAEAVRRAPQLCFEAWAAGANSEYWADKWFADHPMELESRDMVVSFMGKRFAAAQPYRAAEYSDVSPVYVLRSGDETLARIYLSGEGKSWAVSEVDLLVSGDKGASVKAITGSRIYCNGIELGPEYVTDTTVSFTYGPLSDRLVNPVSMMTYTVDGLLSEPTLTAEPPEGCNLVQTEDGGFLLCMSQAEGQPLVDKSVNFVRAYLYYFMSGLSNTNGNLWYALSFLTPGTQAYSDLQDTLNGVIWNTAYANIDTSNTTASDVVIWADNCRSVDVTYSAKCTLNGEPIDYADATMRIYFLQGDNGEFYISNFENL